MDVTATTATCASSPASSAAASASLPPRQPSPAPTNASTAASSAVAVATTPSSSARKPPLGRPRGAAARPRGVARPPPTAASTASTDESDDAGSGDATGVAAVRNCPTRAQALQEFLRSVADEITELVAAFQALPRDARGFASFKSLWRERRLSAMFLVEYWDSTPSDTHHAIFQVALELLEDAVLSATPADDASVCAALGFWFALYCAFCVQLSEPKIKIAVDVVAWQSLTQLSALLTQQLTVLPFANAAREALAMLQRLEHEEDSFLKCLGGAVAEFRLKLRPQRPLVVGELSQASLPELALPPRREEEMEDVVIRLEALNTQYNAALKQLAQVETTTSNNTAQHAVTTSNGGIGGGASRGRGRGRTTPTFLRKSRPSELTGSATGGAGSSFLQEASLWSGARATEHAAWVPRLRQSLFPTKDDGINTHNASNGIVRRRRSSHATLFVDEEDAADDVDAALLALEQELEREEAAVATPSTQPPASREAAGRQTRPPTAKRARAPSASITSIPRLPRASTAVSSGQESDGLDELEAELARDVGSSTVSSSARRAVPAASKRTSASVRVPVKRAPRALSVLSMDTESDGLAELEAELARDTQPGQRPLPPPAAQADPPVARSIVPRVTRSRAISIASTADESDGLEELEAELKRETHPLVQQATVPIRRTESAVTAPVAPRMPRMTKSRAMSIASMGEETDGLDELEAELAREADAIPPAPRVAGLTNRSAGVPRASVKPRVARKRAISIVSSGQESDGLAELEAELEQDLQVVAVPPALRARVSPQQHAANQATNYRAPARQQPQPAANPAARPPRGQTRFSSRFSDVSSVDELSFLQQELDASLAAAPVKAPVARQPAPSRKRSAATAAAAPPSKRLATQSLPKYPAAAAAAPKQTPPTRRSRRLSDASSAMGDSDAELIALQAELAATPTLKASETVTTRLATARTTPRQRLRSMSGDTTESDEELKELQAELAMTTQPAVVAEQTVPESKTKAKATTATKSAAKQPRKRATATAAKKTAVSTGGETLTGVQDKPVQKPKQPRKPRQSKAATTKPKVPVQKTPPPVVTPVVSTPQPPPSAPVVTVRSTRLSSRRSVASSYDSDGLDELEKELRAFD